MMRLVLQQIRMERQIHVLPEHTITLVESEENHWRMKPKSSKELTNFRRNVSNTDIQLLPNTHIENPIKTISVPIVTSENCKALVNDICIDQRDDANLESSTPSLKMATVSATLVLVVTMNL